MRRVDSSADKVLIQLEGQLGKGSDGFGLKEIYYGTTAEWNAQPDLVAEAGLLYVYSDYQTLTDHNGNVTHYPNIKVGDGQTLLSRLPFLATGSVSNFEIDDYVDLIEQCLEEQGKLVSALDRERWDQIGEVNALLGVI